MAGETLIKPDLQFINRVMAAGGDTVKKCYQCDTCSVVCNPTPDSKPFPRKEMLQAQWGMQEVLQDPDICFGCGYCTWVCPYNAPQLDTERGHVHKCNMCVDRLEVGLKPACASACLAGALDFGIIETTPENRVQLETQIPGFPTPEITHPNIRFQQTRSLPREMTRPDAMPLRYEQDEQGQAVFKTKVHESGRSRQWRSAAALWRRPRRDRARGRRAPSPARRAA